MFISRKRAEDQYLFFSLFWKSANAANTFFAVFLRINTVHYFTILALRIDEGRLLRFAILKPI